MKIGFNITDPVSYNVAAQLAATGTIDFVEILIDNFTHLDPHKIANKLHGLDIGFHIMKSEYIERDSTDLQKYGSIIRELASVLKPLYISDHLARFNIHTKVLPITAEINYETEYAIVAERTRQWQDILGTSILLENFPSRTPGTSETQVEFFQTLMNDSNCGILFDLSNAVVASLNGGAQLSKWYSIKNSCQHFHVAGYRTMGKESSEQWIIDSHDTSISEETISFTRSFFNDLKGKSIVIERDANIDIRSITNDILLIKDAWESA